jgi:RNA polymerase sigma factor (sigma-70 family)
MMNDEKIIELFFARSESGISELDNKYGKACHKLSYNIVNNRQDAEECVNDSYLGAWNAIPPERPDPLLTFILRIVRNISFNRYHKNKAAKRSCNYGTALEEIENSIADIKTVESEIEAKELARIIENFLDMQSVENRVIFMRRYWFADGYEDIAALTGFSAKNISVRLTRIRVGLKKYLIEKGVFI